MPCPEAPSFLAGVVIRETNAAGARTGWTAGHHYDIVRSYMPSPKSWTCILEASLLASILHSLHSFFPYQHTRSHHSLQNPARSTRPGRGRTPSQPQHLIPSSSHLSSSYRRKAQTKVSAPTERSYEPGSGHTQERREFIRHRRGRSLGGGQS